MKIPQEERAMKANTGQYGTPFSHFMTKKFGPNWQVTCSRSKISSLLEVFMYAKAVGEADVLADLMVSTKKTLRGKLFGTVRTKAFIRKWGMG